METSEPVFLHEVHYSIKPRRGNYFNGHDAQESIFSRGKCVKQENIHMG